MLNLTTACRYDRSVNSYRPSSLTPLLQPMGWTSEMVAKAYNVPREKQDEYALISHTRAAKVGNSAYA